MRLGLLLLLALLVSGCAATRSVSRSAPSDFDHLNEQLRGRNATVELADGTREEGQVLFVRSDSTAWHSPPHRRSVPTSEVVRVTRHEGGRRVLKGALLGAGVGALLAVAAQSGGDDSVLGPDSGAGYVVAVSAMSAMLGALIGAGTSRRVYVLNP